MYDWANSVYSLVIATAIFPIYFYEVTPGQIEFLGGWFPRESIRAYAISAAYVLIVVFAPLLSGIADARRLKKTFLMSACYFGAAACIGLFGYGAETYMLGLLLFMAATFAFGLSDNFYNAFLPEIATPDRFDRISARGYTLGYLGSTLLLAFSLAVVLQSETFGLTAGEATRFTFVLTGLWWAGFGTFTFVRLRSRHDPEADRKSIWSGFQELRYCVDQLRRMPVLRNFLTVFLLYNIGLQTVMYMATDFGKVELELETGALIGALMAIQIIGMAGAYIFARVSEIRGNIFALKIAVVIWTVIVVTAYFITSAVEFYALGAAVGLVMGGIQSVSRATYSKLIPQAHDANASFFSFYSALDKLSIIVGTAIFGIVREATGSMREAILFLIVFFAASLAALFLIRWNRPDIETGRAEA